MKETKLPRFRMPMRYIGKCKMKETKRCMICGRDATHVCKMGVSGTPRYMCDGHKHLLEIQGEYICEELEE